MIDRPKVLIIEQDTSFGKLIAKELERKDLHVELRADSVGTDDFLARSMPDLLVIDLGMPADNHCEILKGIRAKSRDLPVLVLSASSRAEDLEQAFELGADDFLVKPVSLRELVARARRLLLRDCTLTSSARKSSIVIKRDGLTVFRGGEEIDLTPKEFAILDVLAKNSGKIVSRQSLMEEVWNSSSASSMNVLDVYMKYLRDKIDSGYDRKIIRTVRGVGYILKGGECQYV